MMFDLVSVWKYVGDYFYSNFLFKSIASASKFSLVKKVVLFSISYTSYHLKIAGQLLFIIDINSSEETS